MTVEQILAAFPARHALVAGDICLDLWCTYDPQEAEPSRETGIPRIAVTASELTPGAGGTVAGNLAALGAGTVSVLGVLGDDGHGFELRRALTSRGIRHDLCLTHPDVRTFTYTKLLNTRTGVEDQPRVDFINTKPMPAAVEQEFVGRLHDAAPQFDAVLVSDQAETDAGGVITPAVRQSLSALARQYPEKVFWIDSRLRIEHYRHVIVKPNEGEARAACLRVFQEYSLARLRQHLDTPLMLVTHGARGVLLVQPQEQVWVPTVPVEHPVDICGAGDSFSAGAAVAYAITRDPVASARFGNLVASVTIMKQGTGTASPAEVLAAAARQSL
ncbi:MAG: ribokinase [Acidobacteria bacterium]|nr:ribokinase [Acidobacteriota bacterium]